MRIYIIISTLGGDGHGLVGVGMGRAVTGFPITCENRSHTQGEVGRC